MHFCARCNILSYTRCNSAVSIRRINTAELQILFFFFFRKSCRLWDNVEKYCTAGQATWQYAPCALHAGYVKLQTQVQDRKKRQIHCEDTQNRPNLGNGLQDPFHSLISLRSSPKKVKILIQKLQSYLSLKNVCQTRSHITQGSV